MNLLVYLLVYPLIWFISILPFRILYYISDFFYLLTYYVIGYRKKIVLSNLKLAFPEKKEQELLEIRKKFYKHFVDIFMEMIKTFTISKKELDKHYTYTNIELIKELKKDGKSVILISAHYANWEWIIGMNSYINYNFKFVVSYIDKLFSLKNKIAVVTGAARGNGKVISEALLRSGATVILVDKQKKLLQTTTDSFIKQGLDARGFYGDITNKNNIAWLVVLIFLLFLG